MRNTYSIEVDCANCANKMEEAINRLTGIKNAVINFMTLKLIIEFDDDADKKTVMKEVLKVCKKIERDCEIYF